MNKFYIQEGNKRVSVLKYVGAASIHGYVTRLIPKRSDSLENKIYYEFLEFYKITGMNEVWFTKEGSFRKLKRLDLGQMCLGIRKNRFAPREPMPDSGWHLRKREENAFPLPADAMLVYLETFGMHHLEWVHTTEEKTGRFWKKFICPTRITQSTREEPEKKKETARERQNSGIF